MRKQPRVTNEQGFTLVSVMIAIVLVSVGMLGLFSTQVSAYALTTHANARTAAVNIARAHMETLKATDPRVLSSVPVDPEVVDADGEADPNGAFTRSVTIEPGGTHLKKLTVTVDFPKARTPLKLVTLIYHNTF